MRQAFIIQADSVKSSTEVRAWFRASGITIADWSSQQGFNAALVYAVIKGERKCMRGESHKIAVALGLKSPGSHSA